MTLVTLRPHFWKVWLHISFLWSDYFCFGTHGILWPCSTTKISRTEPVSTWNDSWLWEAPQCHHNKEDKKAEGDRKTTSTSGKLVMPYWNEEKKWLHKGLSSAGMRLQEVPEQQKHWEETWRKRLKEVKQVRDKLSGKGWWYSIVSVMSETLNLT